MRPLPLGGLISSDDLADPAGTGGTGNARISGPRSRYSMALSRELSKRISRHYESRDRSAIARREFTRATGLHGLVPREPKAWGAHPHFHPFVVQQHRKDIAQTISRKLEDWSYEPLPMLEHRIEKPGGGHRTVVSLSIPDAA